MPYLDVVLLVMVMAFSFCTGRNSFVSDTKKIALCGFGAVVATYLHLVSVMVVGGWLLTRKKGKGPDTQ